MVQVDRPLVLVPLVPRLQLVPTCPIWLYYLSFANSLFSILFLVSQCHSIFRKRHLNEKFLKYYHVGEGINDNKIYDKLTFSSDLSPLYQWDPKNIRNLMYSNRTISLCSLQVFSHQKPAAWQTKPNTWNPCHSTLMFSQSFASQASPHVVQ